jgi:DNA-binding winged helix-turn-helix (wHTH) protein
VNFRQRSLERSGQSVSISDTEFALLKLLLCIRLKCCRASASSN